MAGSQDPPAEPERPAAEGAEAAPVASVQNAQVPLVLSLQERSVVHPAVANRRCSAVGSADAVLVDEWNNEREGGDGDDLPGASELPGA